MSKIPYTFITPIPQYFLNNGWFKNENTWKFVMWAFSRCQNVPRKIVICGTEIILEPYEFIAGRLTSSVECFLTEKEFRGQLNFMIRGGILKKGANSRANRFSTYIWVMSHFSNGKGQLEGRPRANRGPTEGHESSDYLLVEDDHQSSPTPSRKTRNGLIDDFSSKKEAEKEEEETYSYLECTLTKTELEKCIHVRGSLEKVQNVIEECCTWKGRKYKINQWCKSICEWNSSGTKSSNNKENEAYGETLESQYRDSAGWVVSIYNNAKKDQKGLLFECPGSQCQPIFVAFSDAKFMEIVNQTIKTKKMKKKGETK